MKHQNDLLDTEAAAAYVRLSPRTLERYRVTGEGPVYLKLGRRVFYRVRDLDLWLDEKRRRSTSDPGPGERRPNGKKRGSLTDSGPGEWRPTRSPAR